MAHQHGVGQCGRHDGHGPDRPACPATAPLRSAVVLVFDADAGGDTGVDRALELFVREDVDLAIATLPEGWTRATCWSSRGRNRSSRP